MPQAPASAANPPRNFQPCLQEPPPFHLEHCPCPSRSRRRTMQGKCPAARGATTAWPPRPLAPGRAPPPGGARLRLVAPPGRTPAPAARGASGEPQAVVQGEARARVSLQNLESSPAGAELRSSTVEPDCGLSRLLTSLRAAQRCGPHGDVVNSTTATYV